MFAHVHGCNSASAKKEPEMAIASETFKIVIMTSVPLERCLTPVALSLKGRSRHATS